MTAKVHSDGWGDIIRDCKAQRNYKRVDSNIPDMQMSHDVFITV